MTLRRTLLDYPHYTAAGFELFEPIAESAHTALGLYNDDRFPGRSILVSKCDARSLDELPPDELLYLMQDVQCAMRAIQRATKAARVNVAFLSNRDPHLHAHLIPRFPEHEQFPDCSPWNDQRPKGVLPPDEVRAIKQCIFDELQAEA